MPSTAAFVKETSTCVYERHGPTTTAPLMLPDGPRTSTVSWQAYAPGIVRSRHFVSW